MPPETVALGICPEHGYVYGDDVEYRFPNPCLCWCGMELESVTMAEFEEVRERA